LYFHSRFETKYLFFSKGAAKMKITCKNKEIETFIKINKRPDGQIAEGVYISIRYNSETGQLVNFWLGTPELGPMLAYHERDGWTPIYSRGDYGKNYSCGGHWSSQNRNLLKTRLIGKPGTGDVTAEILIADGNIIPLPDGIQGDVRMTDIDCSGSWTVFYPSARAAIMAKLTLGEIEKSGLPVRTKKHLAGGMYNLSWKRMYDLTETLLQSA
jgi:hypothetical protein